MEKPRRGHAGAVGDNKPSKEIGRDPSRISPPSRALVLLRSSLARASEPALRARLEKAIAELERAGAV